MNRRNFLHSAVGLMAAPILGRAATSNAPSLGFSLYGMKDLPLDVALKTCAEIGYSHVEFALNPGYPTEPKVFTSDARKKAVELLQKHQLALPCLMINISLTADDKAHAQALKLISEASELARDMNPVSPAILETVLGGKPATWEQQKDGMVAKLHDWAKAAEEAKTVITVKAHIGSAVNSPERLNWLLDQVKSPAIQAAYDFSHFEVQGLDMEETMKALLPRARFIHVKDTKGDPRKFEFLLPGQGRTDYVKYFSLLKKYGYTGPVCVEVSGQVFKKPGYDPIAAAKSSYAALSQALKQVA